MLFSQGTPLVLAGDEFGNSQFGNNNAYAQDNDIGWLDWSGISEDPEFLRTVSKLIGLRKRLPALSLDNFVHGSLRQGTEVTRLDWINPNGNRRDDKDWDFGHAFGALYETERDDGESHCIAVLFNAWDGSLPFELPEAEAGQEWRLEFLSADISPNYVDRSLELPGRSIALLVADGERQ